MESCPPPSPSPLIHQRQMDAIELLLQDLGSVDPQLHHRAAFQSCWRELTQLRGELVTLLLARRHGVRQATDGLSSAGCRPAPAAENVHPSTPKPVPLEGPRFVTRCSHFAGLAGPGVLSQGG